MFRFRTCLNEIVQDATTGRNLSDIHFWQIGIISTITKVSCILFVHYVTIMLCIVVRMLQDSRDNGTINIDCVDPLGGWAVIGQHHNNTDLWLAGQDRAAHGHRQREPGDGGGVAREQGGDQGRAAARHQWGVCGGGGGAAGPWGVHTCGGRALGELDGQKTFKQVRING